MKTRTILSVLLIPFAFELSACSSSNGESASTPPPNINKALPIQIPSILDKAEVQAAIVNAIPATDNELTNNQKIADNALRARLGFFYKKVGDNPDNARWYVEDVRDDAVILGHERRTHYLRVEYSIKGKEIIQRIAGSRNLNQTETSIHKAVYNWIDEMAANIRKSLGKAAAQKINTKSAISSSTQKT